MIMCDAPRRADHEGKAKTDEVEDAPGLAPGNGEDPQVQHPIVREEHHVAPSPCGRENGSEKAAARGDHGERERILQDSERGGKSRDSHKKDEPRKERATRMRTAD